MKPGVSLHATTLFPSLRSAKSETASAASRRVAGPATTSSSRMYRGGLKKWVMRKSRAKLSGIPSVSARHRMVEVLDDTIEPVLRAASIRR